VVQNDAGFAAFIMTESAQLKERSGLRDRVVDGTVVHQVIDPGPAYRELDGSIPFGYLAFLVDAGVGIAARVGSGWEVGGVSNAFSFEALGALGADPISIRAEMTASTDEVALAKGTILDARGAPIGQAMLRSVPVPGRPTSIIEPPEEAPISFAWESDLEPAPIDRSIGLGLKLGERRAVVRTIPRLSWASAYGALYGGAVGLFVHRAIHYAVTSVVPADTVHVPVSFEISFIRPAVCGEDPVDCVATVVSVSKRFVIAEAQMIMPSGKAAALVRATHAVTRHQPD